LTYTVQAGDTLGGIAAKFNSTEPAIIAENKLTDPNALFVGQQLIIPVNLVTPTATRPPTSTPVTATATKKP
jgi:LysM repeat protein